MPTHIAQSRHPRDVLIGDPVFNSNGILFIIHKINKSILKFN